MGLSQTTLAAARHGQYFPTPPEMVSLIAANVRVEHQMPNIGDFSCGEGAALAQLTEIWHGVSWGNELETERYKVACTRLDYCTHGPQETLRAEGLFDVVFLNPPYDMGVSKRYEVEHVNQALESFLMPGGLMIAIVPQHVLAGGDFWQSWLMYTTQTWVMRFPVTHFGFRQHVVFGQRTYTPRQYVWTDALRMKALFEQQASPVTGEPASGVAVLGGNEQDGLILRSSVNRRLTVRSIKNSMPHVWQTMEDYSQMPDHMAGADMGALTVPPDHMVSGRPAMPIKATQVIQLAAAGMLNGQYARIDGEQVMLAGNSVRYKTTVKEQADDDAGNLITRTIETERMAYQVVSLSMQTGTVKKFDSREKAPYQKFIRNNIQSLIDAANAANPAYYQMDYGPYLPVFNQIHSPRNLPGIADGLLTAQKHTTAALFETFQRSPYALLVGEMGVGKLIRATTNVLTTSGWQQAGKIRVGDYLIAVDGTPTTCLGVYPQRDWPLYRITFTDGVSVDCGAEHLWEVNTPMRKWRGSAAKVMSTAELMQVPLHDPEGNTEYFVPVAAPAQMAAQPVPIDPYVLGVLLGDGNITHDSATFTNIDPLLVAEVSRRVGVTTHKAQAERAPAYGIPGVMPALRALGLQGRGSSSKFVPDCYKFNVPGLRLQVLQGLLDTDGTVCTPSHSTIEYCTVSAQLRDDVVFLVQSLGGIATVGEKAAPGYTYKGERR
jgi:hypothetical protein